METNTRGVSEAMVERDMYAFAGIVTHIPAKDAKRVRKAMHAAIVAAIVDAPRLQALTTAGNKLLAAMEMQERRETGEFHLAQPSARAIWDAAKEAWRAALAAALSAPEPAAQGEAVHQYRHKGSSDWYDGVLAEPDAEFETRTLYTAPPAQPADPAATPTEPMIPPPEHAILTLEGGFQVPITRSGDGYVCDWLKAPVQPAERVPELKVVLPDASEIDRWRAIGWNECRNAMLDAASIWIVITGTNRADTPILLFTSWAFAEQYCQQNPHSDGYSIYAATPAAPADGDGKEGHKVCNRNCDCVGPCKAGEE